MKLLTDQARLTCDHRTGIVCLIPPPPLTRPLAQQWVTIEGHPVLVEADPEGKLIVGCANAGPTIKPCSLTLKVTQGYSDLVSIEARRVCLVTVTGLTDGTPPGFVAYGVRDAGQDWVEAQA